MPIAIPFARPATRTICRLAVCSGLTLLGLISPSRSEDLATQAALCATAANAFNTQFANIAGLDPNGDIPVGSGLIVHTIHGPGSKPRELHLKTLQAVKPDLDKSCGDYMTATPPVYLPWCGSNDKPNSTTLSDASSWTYIRHDTLIHHDPSQPPIQRDDEVVCDASNNKRYGLIFSNAFMNAGDNLGCMYPLDGDTGNRSGRGCGVSVNQAILNQMGPTLFKQDAQGYCPLADDASGYLKDFNTLLHQGQSGYSPFSSFAGSLICSLPKRKFDLWVDVRKAVDLSQTSWPVNEFVLWNWDEYTTRDLGDNGIFAGIYYLTGCAAASDGTRAEAQAIADLYTTWTGKPIPVVNLSNAAMRAKSLTPFSCQ